MTEIKKVFYQSFDGKEFESKEECIGWEWHFREVLKRKFGAIKKIDINGIDIGVAYASPDDEMYLVCPKDETEIKVLNAYLDGSCVAIDRHFNNNMINEYTVINFGLDHDYAQVFTLNNLREDLMTSIDFVIDRYNENV